MLALLLKNKNKERKTERINSIKHSCLQFDFPVRVTIFYTIIHSGFM